MYKNLNIIQEDPFYRKIVVSKLLNRLFFDGKKYIAESYLSLFFLTLKTNNFINLEDYSIDCCNFLINTFSPWASAP